MSEKINLDDLYSDGSMFDKQAVLSELKDKIVFSKENEIHFMIDPTEIYARNAILLYALGKKILKRYDKIDSEIITSSEIIDKIKLNKNTVYVTVKRLKDKKMLIPTDSGYEIPAFQVNNVLNLLKEE